MAIKYNKRIMVMEPIKGGSLANTVSIEGKVLSASELASYALRFVGAQPRIGVILSGMVDDVQVRENRNTLEKGIKKIDYKIYESLRKQVESKNIIACTKYGYCKRECLSHIAIPDILALLNSYHNVGVKVTTAVRRHRHFYKAYIDEGNSVGNCMSCRLCENVAHRKLLYENI